MISKTQLLFLALVTIIAFPLLGLLIYSLFSNDPWQLRFISTDPVSIQILVGTCSGLFFALIGFELISLPFMDHLIRKYGNPIAGLKLNHLEIIFISFCAGFGEELLFRAFLQPFAGIWITAFLFIAIHGYLNPFDWRVSLYGIFMVFCIAFMGWLFETSGWLSASVMHMVIDWYLLYRLSNLRYAITLHSEGESF
jgi:membrane protease YdiL (CAAX protease family)